MNANALSSNAAAIEANARRHAAPVMPLTAGEVFEYTRPTGWRAISKAFVCAVLVFIVICGAAHIGHRTFPHSRPTNAAGGR